MKQLIRHLFTLCLFVFVAWGSLLAQNGSARWSLGLGPRALSYQAHPGQPGLGYAAFDPAGYDLAGQFTLSRYLSGWFDFRTHLTFSPRVRFPVNPERRRETWMLDMSYSLVLKTNNGALLRESFPVAPYLRFGVGGSYVADNPDAYFPLGAGLRVRFNHRISLHIETVRQFSLNQDHQHLAHAISFLYNLGGEKPERPEPEEEEAPQIAQVTDTDGDGVMDEVDQCPDTPGEQHLMGCPPQDELTEEEQEGAVATDDLMQDQPQPQVSDLGQDEGYADSGFENGIAGQDQGFLGATTENDPAYGAADPNSPCVNLSDMDVAPVYFTYGSDELLPDTKARLDQLAELMKDCDNMRLVLSGHTDNTGTERDNLTLSVMRAYRVKYYLVYQHGIRQARITSDGMGESQPIANNQDEDARRKNRRVDFRLTL